MIGRYQVVMTISGCGAKCEDRVTAFKSPAGVVIVVADGSGGSGCGGEAADELLCYVRSAATADSGPVDPLEWARRLKLVDEALYRRNLGGETTAVVMTIEPAGIAGASMGDSAAWIIRPQDWIDLTQHQRRKPLIGSGEALPVPFTAPALDGILISGTDGLFKYAAHERIRAVVRQLPLEAAVGQLMELVRLPSGGLQDDVGLVLCAPGER